MGTDVPDNPVARSTMPAMPLSDLAEAREREAHPIRQDRVRPFTSSVSSASANGRCVLQAALRPELVQTASQAQGGLQTDIAFEAFAVIPDLLEDVVGPSIIEPHHLAHFVLDAQQATDLGIVRLGLHVIDIGLGDAELLADEHGEEGPADDIPPLIVA